MLGHTYSGQRLGTVELHMMCTEYSLVYKFCKLNHILLKDLIHYSIKGLTTGDSIKNVIIGAKLADWAVTSRISHDLRVVCVP